MSSPKIINSTALAYAYAIYNYVEAASSGHTGTAIANPVIKGSTVDAYSYDIYNEAYGYYGTGNVTASPAISHSSVTSGSEYVIYNYAESPYQGTSPGGTCTANPSISYGTAAASAYLIYNECYGYYAASTGNPVLRNVNAVAGDDYGIYNDIESSVNGGHGSAIGNPLITGSDIAAYDYVIENDVYGFRGGAVGNPLITNSTVSSSDDYAIYNDIYSDYGSVTSGHTATANPRILSSNVTAYDEPLYNESYGYYGPAFANPVVRSSTLMSTDDDVIENYAYGSNHGGTGSGIANPVVSKSAMRAYDDGLYNESYAGNGSATANPVITSTPIRSLFDTAVYNYAEGDPGGATANPTITGSPILCGDCGSEYGVENEATSAKSFAIADPVLSFSPIRIASGYGLDNEAYSATSAGHGGAKANPTVINSGIVAYEQALYNEAKAEHGNSNADGSFTVTNSYLRSNYYQPAEDYVYGSGTGKTTAKMNLTGDTLRAADDDGIEVYIKPQGTGTSSLGGLVKNSSITSEGDGVYVDFAPTGSSSFTFNTAFLNTPITSTDDDGINVGTESIGRSVLLEPTITNSSITAVDDYAVDLEANGYAGSSTGALTVAPVISGLTSTSDDGIYLLAADDLGSASPGSTVVAGSITNSNITSTDDVGIGAYSECEYCGAGSVERLRVTNSSIKAYDEALSIESTVSSHSTGPAIVGGYATSTKHNSMTSFDDYGVYVDNSASSGKVTDAFHESGFTISGESGPIYNYAYATANSASVSSSFTNNTLPNGNGDSGDDGIYQYVVAGGVGHNATVSGSFSHNVISDAPGNAYGIDLYSSAGGTANTDLTIAHNTITNMGGYGIYVDASGNATPSSTHHVSIVNNTINRVGKGGIWTDGVRPTITANRVYNVGLADGASPGDIDGIFVDDSGHQGSVTCNVVFGNTQGIEYGSGNPTSGAGGHNGDPKTNNNSFKDPSSSLRNVKDLRTANAGAGQTDAQNNYWGGSPRLHSPTNRYDVTPRLTAAPNCTKTAGA